MAAAPTTRDALDLLDHRTRFEEFVFVSGDSDFTPLLHRLRAEDRRTAIVSPGHLSAAYAAAAERVLGFDRIKALLNVTHRKVPEPTTDATVNNTPAASKRSGC